MGIGLALAGLGSLAGGAVKGAMLADEEARLKAADQRAQDSHDAQMRQQNQDWQDRIALRNAAAPATVDAGAGGMTKPAYMDDSDVGLPENANLPNGGLVPGVTVNGQSYPDQASADAAAAKYNSSDARSQRVGDALISQGKPDAAIRLQDASLSLKKNQQDLADRNWQRSLNAAAAGGWGGLENLVNTTDSGPMAGKKIKIVPSADGSSVTVNTVGDDGTLTPTSLTYSNDKTGIAGAAAALDNSVQPEHRLDIMVRQSQAAAQLARQNARDKALDEYHQGMVQNGAGRVQALEDRVAAMNDRNAGAPSREERLKYTSLFSDAGRRLSDAQKTLANFQRDPIFQAALRKNPYGPEAQQLQGLQSDIEQYKSDRQMYQGLLAGSQGSGAGGGGGPSLSTARPATAAPLPASKDQLQTGKWYKTARGIARWNGSAFEGQ